MKTRILVVSLCALGLTAGADTCTVCGVELEQDWVECNGKSATRETAIVRALKEGVSQVYGLNVSGQNALESSSETENTRVDKEKHSQSSSTVSFAEQISSETEGRIKKWKLVSETREGEVTRVHLHAKVINPRKDNVRSVMFMPVTVAQSLRSSVVKLENQRSRTGVQIGGEVGEALLSYLSEETDLRVRTPAGLLGTVEMAKLNTLLVDSGVSAKTELQTMGEVLTTDYLLSVELKDVKYSHKVTFDAKAGKAVPKDRFAVTLRLVLVNVKTGSTAGSATVTSELLNDDIVKLRAADENVKLLDAAMELFGARVVEWVAGATAEK